MAFVKKLSLGWRTMVCCAAAAALTTLALIAGLACAPAAALADEVSTQDMYRLYNPNSGEHFYTASAEERDYLDSIGWNYEGIGWIAPTDGDPVYRLYNPNAGDHHYTLSVTERDHLVSLGWRYEGIGWYSGGSAAVLRQYNPNAIAGAHNFTTSSAENANLVSVGWRGEGVGWYAYAAAHGHTWVAQTETVHHDAVTHQEPVYEYYSYAVCGVCGQVSPGREHMEAHALAGEGSSTYDKYEKRLTGYKTVTDQAAYDETVTTGYKCSTCGATK